MDEEIAEIRAKIDNLLVQLEEIRNQQKAQISYKTRGKKIVFDPAIENRHRKLKTGILDYMFNLPLKTHITAPLVYGMIVPFAFLDLSVVLFQKACFWAWGISRARRSDYVVIDRQHLEYLNGIEKLNCVFCGYANGVIAFTREVASRTEHYWCPIKHAQKIREPHRLYETFTDFGDADAWQNETKLPNQQNKDG